MCTSYGDVLAIDSIEFNERFRFADVAADVAFLSMDLAAHGRVDLAESFLAAGARRCSRASVLSPRALGRTQRARGELSTAEHVVVDTTRPLEVTMAALRTPIATWPERFVG
jgi:hypothetical protein